MNQLKNIYNRIFHTPGENYGPTVKTACWAYLITASLYVLTGFRILQPMFLIVTILVGTTLFITETPEEKSGSENQKLLIGLVIVGFMAINACWTYFYGVHPELRVYPDGPGMWIGNRLVYLFGLALFMPEIIEPFMQTKRSKILWGIFAAGCFFSAFYFAPFSERYHREVIAPESANEKKYPEPWYPWKSLIDDGLLSLTMGVYISLLNVDRNVKKKEARNGVDEPIKVDTPSTTAIVDSPLIAETSLQQI